MSLILVGFSRSGKSYLGNLLSQLMGLPFIDTDRLIEKKYNKKIADLHEELGEQEFRKVEKKTLFSLENKDKAVIATGGGLICDEENANYLQKMGKVVFLDPEKKEIWKRICKGRFPTFLDPKHPVTSFLSLYEDRYPLYESISHHRVEVIDEKQVLPALRRIFESG